MKEYKNLINREKEIYRIACKIIVDATEAADAIDILNAEAAAEDAAKGGNKIRKLLLEN